MMSLLPFWALYLSVVLLSVQHQKALGFHHKYLNLCFDERRSCRFGTTWGWVINYIIFIFGWAIPLKYIEIKKKTVIQNCNILQYCFVQINAALKSAWIGSSDCLFFSTVTSIWVKRHLKWEGGTWFHPSRIDWIIGSWGVANKMEADLNASLQLVVRGFLSTGFFFYWGWRGRSTAQNLPNSARERERDCLNDWAHPPSGWHIHKNKLFAMSQE